MVNRESLSKPWAGDDDNESISTDSFPQWYLLRGSAGLSVGGGLQKGEIESEFDWQTPAGCKKPDSLKGKSIDWGYGSYLTYASVDWTPH